jgi:hypothetical protein
MPAPSTSDLTSSRPFPDDPGEPIWEERRAFPVLVVGAPPVAFLAIAAIAVRPLAVHVALAAATIAALWLLIRFRDRGLIETYAVSDRFVTVEQPRGGRLAIPIERLTGVTLAGDRVRLSSRDGVVTLGFVAHQRALVRALERVAGGLVVEREIDPLCPT